MLTFITFILVIVAIIGLLISLPNNKRITTVGALWRACTIGTVFTYRTLRDTIKVAYKSGKVAGATLSKESDEVFQKIEDFNSTIDRNGGAVRTGIKASQAVENFLGIDEANKRLDEYLVELDKSLEE